MGYARLRLLLEHDELSTYPDPKRHRVEVALTPDEEIVNFGVDAGASGSALTVTTTMFTTITALIVEHGGASGASNVTVVYTNTTPSVAGDLCTVILAQGGIPLMVPDVDATANFTLESASTDTPKMHITILGT